MAAGRADDAAATAPLWRAAQAFRLVTVLYAVGQQIASVDSYREPGLSWLLIGVLVVWSVVSAILLSQWADPESARRHTAVVLGDHAVVIALMASTRLVADYDWYHGHQTLPTTLWAANAVMSAAIRWGPVGGVLSGLLISAVSIAVREQWELDLWNDATAPVLVSVGLAIGLAASTARRAQRQLEAAMRLTAAAQERERLAREVHDGVLQVLSYIKRRGSEIGGGTAELAQRAGEQEVALRVLISEQGARSESSSTHVDLRPWLTAQASPSVFVSTPGDPVRIGEWTAREIAAAVAAALSNTALHAGTDAKAYVLLEDMGDALVVSIRDDGPGIAPGRLADAAAEGRMGVARSIVGRIEALGGEAELLTTDEGAEWEFRVPRTAGAGW
ncbi:MacS family sensor histidine kinase [Nocardia sp. N2S4-5]|uniref:MacS family sensor histidine kinase n=1 Tax=Nocardia sp. N2S4-5 TaxID=3351565 RepID=UPI0037D3BAA9